MAKTTEKACTSCGVRQELAPNLVSWANDSTPIGSSNRRLRMNSIQALKIIQTQELGCRDIPGMIRRYSRVLLRKIAALPFRLEAERQCIFHFPGLRLNSRFWSGGWSCARKAVGTAPTPIARAGHATSRTKFPAEINGTKSRVHSST